MPGFHILLIVRLSFVSDYKCKLSVQYGHSNLWSRRGNCAIAILWYWCNSPQFFFPLAHIIGMVIWKVWAVFFFPPFLLIFLRHKTSILFSITHEWPLLFAYSPHFSTWKISSPDLDGRQHSLPSFCKSLQDTVMLMLQYSIFFIIQSGASL